MSRNFVHYRNAAEDVRRGWLRGDYYNGNGDKCLVQGVLNSTHIQGRVLPPQMVEEIDRELSQYRYYRILRFAMVSSGRSKQGAIMGWNDAFWRRKKTVVNALAQLTDKHEMQWLKDERLRLSIECSSLREEVTALKARIERLEDENRRLWQRFMDHFTLKADREQLEQLESELSARWNELQQLPEPVR